MNKYERNVKRGIRTSVDYIYPNMNITKNAVELIAMCLSSLNVKLVNSCIQNAYSKNRRQGIQKDAAQKAIKKLFRGELQNCALAVAHQNVMKYNVGLLKYKPPIKVKKQEVIKAHPKFMRGIPAIAEIINPEIYLDAKAKKLLALILQKGCEILVKKSQEVSRGQGSLATIDVIKAVDNCMSATMTLHAISEGHRNSLLFTHGMSEICSEDFEKRQRRAAKHKTAKLPFAGKKRI